MHFDRQLLYLAFIFGAERVSGLAIDTAHRTPPRPAALLGKNRANFVAAAGEKLALASSSDLPYTTHDGNMAQATRLESFGDVISHTESPDTQRPPSPTSRSLAAASRMGYAAHSSISSLSPSKIAQDHGYRIDIEQTSISSLPSLPAVTSDAQPDFSAHLELRQEVEDAPCSTDGQLICNGPNEFGICSFGRVTFEPVAIGTACVDGKITYDNISPAGVSPASTRTSPPSTSTRRSRTSPTRSPTASSRSTMSTSRSSKSQSQSQTTISHTTPTSRSTTTHRSGTTTHHRGTTTSPTTPTSHTRTHHSTSSQSSNPSVVPPGDSSPDSSGLTISNASVAGLVVGLAAAVVLLGVAGLYFYRRRQSGKPFFGARGSKRSTGSYYPKSAWLYDPQISTPSHSRVPSEAGEHLIPAPRPGTVEMEAGNAIPGSPDMRPSRSSSPLLPPAISITRDESPDGSPHRSGGRRTRPMMSINEEED